MPEKPGKGKIQMPSLGFYGGQGVGRYKGKGWGGGAPLHRRVLEMEGTFVTPMRDFRVLSPQKARLGHRASLSLSLAVWAPRSSQQCRLGKASCKTAHTDLRKNAYGGYAACDQENSGPHYTIL